MRIKTDHHDAHLAVMSCDACMMESRLSTYSPVFSELLATFAVMHSTCATQGRPDFGAVMDDMQPGGVIAERMERTMADEPESSTNEIALLGAIGVARRNDPTADIDLNGLHLHH